MATYKTILTDQGAAVVADSIANGTPITFAQMALGDGASDPVSSQTALQNEVHRAAVTAVQVDPASDDQIIITLTIGPEPGGWTIREVGLFDGNGDLVAIGRYPDSYKPILTEGSGKSLTIDMVLAVTSEANVTLTTNPTGLATKCDLADISGFDTGDIKWSAKPLTTDPDGWLRCDGRAINRTTYEGLFSALGISHGQGDGSTTFNIPDYRGRGLRALDDMGTTEGAAGRDPDAAGRSAMATGGNTGGDVGSVQEDAFQGHKHPDLGHTQDHDFPTSELYEVGTGGGDIWMKRQGVETKTTQTGYADIGDPVENTNGTPRLSDETRMKNAYVHVLIKT